MMKIAMSAAAAGLIRELLARSAVERDAVLLTDYRSTDWHSLTFAGERHEIGLRVAGPGAAAIVARLVDGLGETEFTIPGNFVADIAVRRTPKGDDDGGDLSRSRGPDDHGIAYTRPWPSGVSAG